MPRVATLASVAGGWLGYAIGYFLFEAIGRPIIALLSPRGRLRLVPGLVHRIRRLDRAAKGMTPIPFKLVTIASGVGHLDPAGVHPGLDRLAGHALLSGGRAAAIFRRARSALSSKGA